MNTFMKNRELNNLSISKKVYIFDFCLFWLSILYFVSNVELFMDNIIFLEIQNFVELFFYFLLIYVIFNKKYTEKQLAIIIVVTSLLTYGMYKSGMSAFVFAWLLIVASKGEKYTRLIKVLYYSLLISFVIGIGCYIFTIDWESFVFQLKTGLTLGFVQKNQTGLIFAYLYLMKKIWNNKIEKPRKELVHTIVYSGITFLITRSKTASVVILLYPIFMYIYELATKKKNKCILLITKFLVPFLFLFNYILGKTFLISEFSQFVDKILTNRIFLNWFLLSKNSLTLWGQNVQLNYTGIHNPIRDTWNITTTVDNGYIFSIVVMGIIPTILFAIGYMKIIDIAWKEKNLKTLTIAVIIALYGITEIKTINIFFNFVYLYLNSKRKKDYIYKKRR
ncbi:hypothetical protein C815_00549 [Firmicutes bacterium M10-2]|nr:hypothetical protein C815_00549 [Firmicutes bacterium M10-2]